ncbi:MAG: hypothetical protein V1881_04180 [Candidatus Micrarchaeota archaeon]
MKLKFKRRQSLRSAAGRRKLTENTIGGLQEIYRSLTPGERRAFLRHGQNPILISNVFGCSAGCRNCCMASPKIKPVYGNTEKILDSLKRITHYGGGRIRGIAFRVVFSGFGEPVEDPNFGKLVEGARSLLGEDARLTAITGLCSGLDRETFAERLGGMRGLDVLSLSVDAQHYAGFLKNMESRGELAGLSPRERTEKALGEMRERIRLVLDAAKKHGVYVNFGIIAKTRNLETDRAYAEFSALVRGAMTVGEREKTGPIVPRRMLRRGHDVGIDSEGMIIYHDGTFSLKSLPPAVFLPGRKGATFLSPKAVRRS